MRPVSSLHSPLIILLISLPIVIAITAVVLGNTPDGPYHILPGFPENCAQIATNERCTQSYYQEYKDFDLGFAEYDDRGNAFSDIFISDVLNRIRSKADNQGIILIVFVHSWMHTAREDDAMLVDFKWWLRELSENLKRTYYAITPGPDRLIGLYVGWRGTSLDVPILDSMTFWNRKAVADEVGKSGVSQLLLELDAISGSGKSSTMITIGHGMGGAIVISALSDLLIDRFVHRGMSQPYVRNVGDSVILLNPVIEAKRLLPVIEAAIRYDYRPDQRPVLISLSTDADTATHYMFPVGQALRYLLSSEPDAIVRSWYYDRLQPQEAKSMPSKYLDTIAAGNFAPFLTHRLVATIHNDKTQFHIQTCDEVPKSCAPMGLTSMAGLPAIRGLPSNYPLYFLKTDHSIMYDHNDFFNSRLRSFLITIIEDIMRSRFRGHRQKTVDDIYATEPAILNNRVKFEQVMEATLNAYPTN